MIMLPISKVSLSIKLVFGNSFQEVLEDFQGDLMKQRLSTTGFPEEYSKYSEEAPVTEWPCFWVFPGKSSKIFLNMLHF